MILFLPAILIFSAVLRFYHNISVSLWHDEAFSALYLRYPWEEMMTRIGLDVHPPLYYIILRLWTNFTGDGLFALRLLSIIFGVLTVWATYHFVKSTFKHKRLAVIATVLVAINPFQIQYALEARMYTLGTFLIIWSSYFLTRALESEHKYKYWLGYALTVAAALYTHYYLLFSVAAQGLFLLIYALRNRTFSDLAKGTAAYAAVLVCYLPWIPTLLQQIQRVEKNYWIPSMTAWSIPGTLWKMIFGGTGMRNSVLLISTITVAVILFYFAKKVTSFHKWHVFFGTAIPFVAAVVLSLRSEIYLDRYFVFASIYFTILIGFAFYYIPRFFIRWFTLGLLVSSMLLAFFKNWTELGIETKPGMAAAAEQVNQSANKNDRIIIGSSFIYFTFKYYNETGIPPQLISDRLIKDIPHFSGTAILADDDLILDLNKLAKGQTIWVLWTTGFGGSKPNLPQNWQQTNSAKYADAPGFKGEIYVEQYKIR